MEEVHQEIHAVNAVTLNHSQLPALSLPIHSLYPHRVCVHIWLVTLYGL